MIDAKSDLFSIMDAVPDGYDALLLAIIEGRIDGIWPKISSWGRRGSIKAQLAEYRKCDPEDLPGLAKKQRPMSPVEYSPTTCAWVIRQKRRKF